MKLKIAIIGLGNIGHRFGCSAQGDPLSHSFAYARQSDVEIVMGIDPAPDAADDFLRKFPHAAVYRGLDAVPSSMSVDVVSVCSPTSEHAVGVRAALAWGAKAILCEKPIAPTIAEAEALLAEAELFNSTLVVNYSRRWTPMLQQLNELTREDGPIGSVAGAVLRYNGGLNHNGTHWIDLLHALFGPVEQAFCLDPFVTGDDPAESILMSWGNGMKAYLLSVHARGFSIGEGEFWGKRGLIRYRDGGSTVVLQREEDSAWPGYTGLGPQTVLCQNGLEGHLLGAVEEVVQLARTGGESRSPALFGLQAMQVVAMARQQRIFNFNQ